VLHEDRAAAFRQVHETTGSHTDSSGGIDHHADVAGDAYALVPTPRDPFMRRAHVVLIGACEPGHEPTFI
jgi:hypothetical protein